MSEDEAPSLAEGAKLGQFRVKRRIGGGTFGEVYEAWHEALERRCALKVIHLRIRANEEMRARFVREARAAAALKHQHVVTVLDFGLVDENLYIAMELLEGETLRERMERGPMTLTEVADVMLPVASALVAAHRAGVVHRDLKPENIMLTKGRSGAVHPTLIDFGLARVRTEEGRRLTEVGVVVGTPRYTSPEQIRESLRVDHRADLWAFGVILFEASTGTKMFPATEALEIINMVLSAPIPRVRERSPELPEEFDALVSKLLQRLLALRHADMLDAGAALLPFASPGVQARFAEEFGAEVTSINLRPSRTSGEALLPPPRVRRTDPPRPVATLLQPEGSVVLPMQGVPRRWAFAAAIMGILALLAGLYLKLTSRL